MKKGSTKCGHPRLRVHTFGDKTSIKFCPDCDGFKGARQKVLNDKIDLRGFTREERHNVAARVRAVANPQPQKEPPVPVEILSPEIVDKGAVQLQICPPAVSYDEYEREMRRRSEENVEKIAPKTAPTAKKQTALRAECLDDAGRLRSKFYPAYAKSKC